MGGKCCHAIQDGCPQLSYILCFGRQDPQGREIAKYGVFRPFRPRTGLGHLWKSQAQSENGKRHKFPVLGGVPKREKKVTMLSGMVFRNFLTSYVLTDRTPRGRKSQNMGFLGHFGQRKRNPGRRPKTGGKHNSPVLGAPRRKKKLPRYPGWLSAIFLHLTFWPTGPPRAGNREIWGFSATLA